MLIVYKMLLPFPLFLLLLLFDRLFFYHITIAWSGGNLIYASLPLYVLYVPSSRHSHSLATSPFAIRYTLHAREFCTSSEWKWMLQTGNDEYQVSLFILRDYSDTKSCCANGIRFRMVFVALASISGIRSSFISFLLKTKLEIFIHVFTLTPRSQLLIEPFAFVYCTNMRCGVYIRNILHTWSWWPN